MHIFPALMTFQSTLPRRERHIAEILSNLNFAISIHAPTQGATRKEEKTMANLYISIHAPTQGATPVLLFLDHISAFQSTLPRRERQKSTMPSTLRENFNPRSHAGSDSTSPCRCRAKTNFNPRSHAGSDVLELIRGEAMTAFQSTLPRRERHKGGILCLPLDKFQSTLPRRERPPPTESP